MPSFQVRKLHIGFFTISLLIAVIGLYAYRLPDQQSRQGAWVVHTHEVLNQLETLSNDLSDAETGQRGYLLTGQLIYLYPYSTAVQHIDMDVNYLQWLTRDNPRQQEQIPSLRIHIATKLAELKETIDLRKSLSPGAALKVVFTGRGRNQMELLRRQIVRMKAEEQRLLRQRIAKWHTAAVWTRLMFLGGGTMLYVLLGVVYLVIWKDAAFRNRLLTVERQAAQDQLTEAERLARVVAIQQEVAGARQDLQTTIQVITERTQHITNADAGVVEMLEGDEMVYRAASGTAHPYLGLRLKALTSLSGRSVRENATLTCDDSETDERVDKAACRKVGVRSMVVVPLRHSGQAIGVLKVLSSRAGAFNDKDVATLVLMAGVLSASLSDAMVTEVLRASEERLEEAQQVAQVGSWEFDVASQKITWSKELFRLIGMDPQAGEPDYATNLTLYTPEDAAQVDAFVQRAIQEGLGYELNLRRANVEGQKVCWHHAVGKPVFDSCGKVVRLVGTLTDITERKRHAEEMEAANEWLAEANGLLKSQKEELETANARLEALATMDGLTGLKNHRNFQERLAEEYQRALRYETPLSVVLLDVDHFKQFNDTFGHPAGDDVLKRVGAILQASARTTDLVARYGGEEFVLLLPETDAQGAVQTAERTRHAIAGANWEQRAITVSVGASTVNLTIENAAHLVDSADKALYLSKTCGRNRVTHANAEPLNIESLIAST